MCAGVVQIAPVANPNEVRDLRRRIERGAVAHHDSGGNLGPCGRQFLHGHPGHALIGIRCDPGSGVEDAQQGFKN